MAQGSTKTSARTAAHSGHKAYVYERAGRTGETSFRVMWREGGKQPQESFFDRESAEEFQRLVERIGGTAARRVLEARHGAEDDMPTLREFTARYLNPASGLLTGIEAGTRRGYERIAELSWLPMLGEYPINAIQKDDIGRWLAWQEQQPSARGKDGATVAAKTVRNYHGLLSGVLACAVDQKLRDDNPAYRMRLSRGVPRDAVFLTPDEFATLLHFVHPRYERFLMFLAGTGCRWGEATAVTWSAVNLTVSPPTVRIDKAWKAGPNGPVLKQPKSRKSIRTISITPDVVAAMGTRGRSSDMVFAGPISGGHLWHSGFRTRIWEPMVDKATDVELCAREGVTPLSRRPKLHDLRHSHASWLIAAGVPLPYIQARLGHESINTTVGVYGHLVPDAHVILADAIGVTLAGVRPLRAGAELTAAAPLELETIEGELDPEDDPESDLYWDEDADVA